jgi:hypothetical protein
MADDVMLTEAAGPKYAAAYDIAGRLHQVVVTPGEYETVAASQTNQVLGGTGATGDYLNGVIIIPATTSPGAVSIKDGANAAITLFTGGTNSFLTSFRCTFLSARAPPRALGRSRPAPMSRSLR